MGRNKTFTYNTVLHETTGYNPCRLVHGGDAITTLDAMLPHQSGEGNYSYYAAWFSQ